MAGQSDLRAGLAHHRAGRLDAAERSFRAAVSADPRSAKAQYHLGVVLHARESFADAVDAFEAAAALDPGLVNARLWLGIILTQTGDFARGEHALRAAIAAAPDNVHAHRLLGDLLRTRGSLGEARRAYLDALARDPADQDARFGVAFIRLAKGELPEAWDDYEFRKSKIGPVPALMPVWNGEDVTGKTVLVHGEQGLGDAVQFLRYVPLLAARGATVLAAVPPAIMALTASVEGVARVLEPTYALPRFDFSCALPGLPRLFRSTLETIPRAAPYLRADAKRLAGWRERLGETGELTVAIAWRGNPGHPDNDRRSIAPSDLAPLFSVPGVRFLTVQKDDADAPAAENILRCGAHDLDDIAAILSIADLTISVDTVFCHLAGALGRPVWTLLAVSPDWRWQTAGEATPWYPTMRLFRQHEPGDWAGVVARVAHALGSRVTGEDPRGPRVFGVPQAPVSWGELIDKLTILQIKQQRVSAAGARANIAKELSALEAIARPVFDSGALPQDVVSQLRAVNETLWEVEDQIRAKEAKQEFDGAFIALARSVYRINDDRSALKRAINAHLSSELNEEKQYAPY
jgi:tetratricopeptide (TPR) repeat protein